MQIISLTQWVSHQKKGKKGNEKTQTERKAFDSNELQTLLIFRVFATNFAVGDLYASYERHFVKKIQHYFLVSVACQQFYICYIVVAFRCRSSFHERSAE